MQDLLQALQTSTTSPTEESSNPPSVLSQSASAPPHTSASSSSSLLPMAITSRFVSLPVTYSSSTKVCKSLFNVPYPWNYFKICFSLQGSVHHKCGNFLQNPSGSTLDSRHPFTVITVILSRHQSVGPSCHLPSSSAPSSGPWIRESPKPAPVGCPPSPVCVPTSEISSLSVRLMPRGHLHSTISLGRMSGSQLSTSDYSSHLKSLHFTGPVLITHQMRV